MILDQFKSERLLGGSGRAASARGRWSSGLSAFAADFDFSHATACLALAATIARGTR